jgi:hypothetical protein
VAAAQAGRAILELGQTRESKHITGPHALDIIPACIPLADFHPIQPVEGPTRAKTVARKKKKEEEPLQLGPLCEYWPLAGWNMLAGSVWSSGPGMAKQQASGCKSCSTRRVQSTQDTSGCCWGPGPCGPAPSTHAARRRQPWLPSPSLPYPSLHIVGAATATH